MASSSKIRHYHAIRDACEEGDLNALMWIGFDVRQQFDDDSECTALHVAADNGHLHVVKHLILRGADPNKQNFDGCTSLDYAARSGHLGIVKYLLSQGANPYAGTSSTLHKATYFCKIEVTKHLLEVCRVDPNAVDSFRRTPLHEVARLANPKRLEIATALLDHGALVNATNNDCWTPIMVAVAHVTFDFPHFKLDMVDLLRRRGADLHAVNDKGETLLHIAYHYGAHDSLISYLTGHGVDTAARDVHGKTAPERAHYKSKHARLPQ